MLIKKIFANTITFYIVLALFMALVIAMSNTAYANTSDCGPYETCPPEIKNTSFSVEKHVRVVGTESYYNEIDAKPGMTLEFRIKAHNTGDVAVDEMQIFDYLPVELELVEGKISNTFNNFKAGSSHEVTLKTKVKDNLAKEICLVNTAELKYKNNPVASDSATVCIHLGEVLSATQELPRTADVNSLKLFALFFSPMTIMGIGLFLSRRHSVQ